MLWCPKCKVEYREGFDQCDDCGHALEEMPCAKPEDEASCNRVAEDAGTEVFLSGSNDAFTIQIMCEALKDAGIPCICKKRGAGEYLEVYMGVSWLGADLYVPSRLLTRAKEIIAIYTDELHHITPPKEAIIEENREELPRRKAARWMVAFYIFVGVLPGFVLIVLWLTGILK